MVEEMVDGLNVIGDFAEEGWFGKLLSEVRRFHFHWTFFNQMRFYFLAEVGFLLILDV